MEKKSEGKNVMLLLMTKRIAALVLLLTAFLFSAVARETLDISTVRTFDWETGIIIIDLTSRLAGTDRALPANRFHTEQQISRQLPVITREQLSDLCIDSWFTVGSYMETKRPDLFRPLEELHRDMTRLYTKTTNDLQQISIRYRLNLYPDVIDLFINHEITQPVPRLLEYEPTKEFSGIIIYARGSLPVHGTREEAELTPCLFPRIYDEEMNLILDKEMIAPELLRMQGMAAYASSSDENPFAARISEEGKEPMRIMARGIYGKNHTDIIIPAEAARRILALEENRQLLAKGRILIIR